MYSPILILASLVSQDVGDPDQLQPPPEARGADYSQLDGSGRRSIGRDNVRSNSRIGNSTRARISGDESPAVGSPAASHAQFERAEARPADTAALSVLQHAMTPPEQGMIAGRPVMLQEVLERVSGARERAQAAKVYWRLADAVMSYHLAYDEARFWETLPDTNAVADEALIVAARTNAFAHESETKQAVLESQFALGDIVSSPANELPLPADLPLVAPYRTRLAEIYPGDSAPRELKRIDRVLPHLLDAIRQRAIAVTAAVRATEAVRDGYRDGSIPSGTLVGIHTNLHQQRSLFLTNVRRYNDLIADYAMSVSGGSAPTSQAVAMLIGRPRRAATTFGTGEVVPANASNFVEPRGSTFR